MIFLDTCVLIDYFRETIEITEEDKKRYCVNSIVQMEAIMGARDKRELIKIVKPTRLREQVKRCNPAARRTNIDRFTKDFMFQLTKQANVVVQG